MKKHVLTYALGLFLSLGLFACDSSDIGPTIEVPVYKNINFQAFHFANLYDQNSQFDDAVNITATYTDPESGLDESSLLETNVYGTSSYSPFLFNDSQNKSQFEIAVSLYDTNSQLLLAENTKNLYLEPDQWVFALGPYANNGYRLKQLDRPEIPANEDGAVTITVMNLVSLIEPQPVDVYLNGAGVQSSLQPETLSNLLQLNPNSVYRLELKKAGSSEQITGCTLTTENDNRIVVFTPDLKCRDIPILESQL